MNRLIGFSLILAACATWPAAAIDRDGYGLTLTPKQRAYVKDLRSNDGVPCCDASDGYETQVQLTKLGGTSGFDAWWPEGKMWVAVKAEALIQPNLLGVTRAWFAYDSDDGDDDGGSVYVRCLLVGTQQ
jgi:hypothetical protein